MKVELERELMDLAMDTVRYRLRIRGILNGSQDERKSVT